MKKCSVDIGRAVSYKGINYYAGAVLEMDDKDAAEHEKQGDVTILKDATAAKPKKEDVKCLSMEEK